MPFQNGCRSEDLEASNTNRTVCDEACKRNGAQRCVFWYQAASKTGICSTFFETTAGDCDAPLETISEYMHWDVCGNGAQRHLLACVLVPVRSCICATFIWLRVGGNHAAVVHHLCGTGQCSERPCWSEGTIVSRHMLTEQ